MANAGALNNLFDPLQAAEDAWSEAFREGPHSTYLMIDRLRESLNLSDSDIIEAPGELARWSSDNFTEEDCFNGPFRDTWSLQTGRCTSFAMKVAFRLAMEHDGVYRFRFFDLAGRHRVARCERTGILIDSDYNGATIQSLGNLWASQRLGLTGRWRLHGNVSRFESQGEISRSIEAWQAMGTCLQDVARRAMALCYFRDVIPTERGLTPIYRGMVRWNFEEHRIILMPDGARRERRLHITFSSSGTQDTRRQCVTNFVRFVNAYGVRAQWEADGTNRIHQRLWLAAERAWGLPRWTEHL